MMAPERQFPASKVKVPCAFQAALSEGFCPYCLVPLRIIAGSNCPYCPRCRGCWSHG